MLRKLYDLMVAKADDLGAILTAWRWSQARWRKPKGARSLSNGAPSFIEWFPPEGGAKRVYGDRDPRGAL